MNSECIDLSVVLTLCIVFVCPGWAPAQTCEWLPGQDKPGADGIVRAIAIYNDELIVGGDFPRAGTVPSKYIARWDGNNWRSLTGGMSNPVYALTVYNGELIAGGKFFIAGGVSCSRVARWDGSTWQPLGSGLGGANTTVYALTIYNGELIAAGDFTTAGGLPCN